MTDPVTVSEYILPRSMDGGDMIIRSTYTRPAMLEPWEPDLWYERDEWFKHRMRNWLHRKFPGYPWDTMHDGAHGVAGIRISILMGGTNWYAINLKKTELADGVVRGANELLERYRQSRERFNLGAFLDARARYSSLVVPSHKVPT